MSDITSSECQCSCVGVQYGDVDVGARAIVFNEEDIVEATKFRLKRHNILGKMLPKNSQRGLISPLKMVASRETNYNGRSRFTSSDTCYLSSRYLPFNGPSVITSITSGAVVSQFSADGTLFLAGLEDGNMMIYDVDNGWKVKNNIRARQFQVQLNDVALSPDRSRLVYTTMYHISYIVNIDSDANVTESLDFSGNNADVDDNPIEKFAIMSLKFSPEGRSVVAGCGRGDNSIYNYDIEKRKLNLRIPAHEGYVRAVCFADEAGDVLYSGSDDHSIKVWDRRSHLTPNGVACGVLTGHLFRICSIDSRGDGRYLISNAGDNSIKLWDIRKMTSNNSVHDPEVFIECPTFYISWETYFRTHRHPNDQSVFTYRGHKGSIVQCHFSPLHNTGQSYIYTGSTDNCIYIYELVTGAQVARLEFHKDFVRDCSWHPFNPQLVSSSCDGVIADWSR